MINDIEKIFFAPGDLVVLKHKELKSPVMLVQEKDNLSKEAKYVMYLKDLNADGLIKMMYCRKQYFQQKIYNFIIKNK